MSLKSYCNPWFCTWANRTFIRICGRQKKKKEKKNKKKKKRKEKIHGNEIPGEIARNYLFSWLNKFIIDFALLEK